MSYTQLLTPTPNVPCREGMCLEYVRTTFGVSRIVYGRAIDAWQGSTTQHPDWNFPEGCAVPVYFTIAGIPAGHVALRVPDGSVWSSSDLGTVPHHHPSMADLLNYYAYYGKPLTYLGWTEDIENTPVVSMDGSINFQSTDTPQEEDPLAGYTPEQLIGFAEQGATNALNHQVKDSEGQMVSPYDVARILRPLVHAVPHDTMEYQVARGGANVTGETSLSGMVAYFDQSRIDTIAAMSAAEIANAVPANLAQQVIDALAAKLTTK